VTEEVCAEGIGLGFFGRHALAVAEALPDEMSHVYGLNRGLLFRAWLPEERRVTRVQLAEDGHAIAEHIARYVHRRNRALPLRDDLSLRLLGRDAAWELVAGMLAGAFGRARQVVRPLTHAAARRLVRVRQPSVIDGATAPWSWFADSAAGLGRLTKAEVDTRAFSNEGIPSCDPILDLARAAAAAEAAGVGEVPERLREDFEAISGELVGDERWLVYRLVHHLAEHRSLVRQLAAEPREGQEHVETLLSLERTMASIYRRYVAGRYLADLSPQTSGPFCAIDIDGVLESRWLAFPVLAPAGALALRALNLHGYRVLLVTGRSLPEVSERCDAYGLPGGVAEYGAAVHDHLSGTDRILVGPDDRAARAELESALRERPGTYVDPEFRHSLRAQAVDGMGRRTALGTEVIQAALARPAVRERVRVVQGDLQTDFVGSTLDKGRGVRALMREFGEDGDLGRPLALGVGDTVSDLPFLGLAEHAFAPGNAAPELRGKVRVLRRSYQSGLLDAVARLVGHQPSSCSICRPPPPPSRDARLFLTALAALNGGKAGKAAQALSLAALLVTV
jgi:hydroxymethylpyrimidine pyrophosphatase-like HAD family hydrolase